LRKIVQQPEWVKDEEAHTFLRLAESLLGGKAPAPKERGMVLLWLPAERGRLRKTLAFSLQLWVE
jgi:hypothetical protein